MLKYLLIILLLFSTLNIQLKSQEKTTMSDLTQIITEIQNKYAPDKRVAVFQVTVKEDNENFILEGITNLSQAREELITKLKELRIKYTDYIEFLPDKRLGDKTYAVINLSVANIRTKPDHPEEMATQSLLGTIVKVLQEYHGFYMIQTPDEYIGWVDDDGIQLMARTEAEEWRSAPKVIYMNVYGFSYTNPDEESEHVSDLVEGDLLRIIAEEDDFYKVQYPDKREAYIPVKQVMKYEEWIENLDFTAENILKTAKSFMGIPYLWGGTSMKGVDCSGFTKTVFYLNGVILPRDASQQAYVGDRVDTEKGFDNLQPGDLVFFGRKAQGDRKERATHVGIYIGNKEYIHSAGRVRINSFDKNASNFNQYRLNSFLKATRILTSLDKNGVYLLKNHKSYAEVSQ